MDRWDQDGVRFIFGIDATDEAERTGGRTAAGSLENAASPGEDAGEDRSRGQRPENVKQQIVEAREFEDIRTVREHVAEFTYRPEKCAKAYRVVVVWKDLEVYRGQKMLFDKARCFFYITNVERKPAEQIVFDGQRPLRTGEPPGRAEGRRAVADGARWTTCCRNGAYMVMASLAWSLKAWSALMLPEAGRWEEKHREEKRKLLRMEFSTFRQAMVNIPAQILRTGRKIVCRLVGLESLAARLLPLVGAASIAP